MTLYLVISVISRMFTLIMSSLVFRVAVRDSIFAAWAFLWLSISDSNDCSSAKETCMPGKQVVMQYDYRCTEKLTLMILCQINQVTFSSFSLLSALFSASVFCASSFSRRTTVFLCRCRFSIMYSLFLFNSSASIQIKEDRRWDHNGATGRM